MEQVQTGYYKTYVKDINPYSPTYGTEEGQRYFDPVECPPTKDTVIEFVIDTNLFDTSANEPYIINGRNGHNPDNPYTVDWGDGTIQTSDTFEWGSSGNLQNVVNHTYAEKGEYTVKIHIPAQTDEDVLKEWSLYTYGFNINTWPVVRINKLITSNLCARWAGLFYYCRNVKGFDDNFCLISNYGDSTQQNTMSLSYMFYDLGHNNNEDIQLPGKLFQGVGYDSENVTEIYLSSAFANQAGDTNHYLLGNLQDIFNGFDFTKVENISYMFRGQSKITGEALPIINAYIAAHPNYSRSDVQQAFYGCTSLSDYTSIPANFR